VIDRERYTCAGGTAALDLILHLVSHVYGDGLAQAIANQFQVDRIRPGKIAQRPADLAPTETLPEHLKVAIDLMKKNLEGNMGVEEIIRRSGVSARAMQRNFKRHLATSPGQFFIRLRLEHAKNLIRHTALPLTEIAISSGFNSASYFANCYRHHYGYTPSQERAATFAGGKAPLER
jgi:transcriptional regulator GlxA family with amidase domain